MGLIQRIAHKLLFRHLGYGSRVDRKTWEEQFHGDAWSYLDSEEESARYYTIISFYEQFNREGTLLDVGCGKGVLYKYFKQKLQLSGNHYTGIDISKNAATAAAQQFPDTTFKQIDFEYENINKKFDLIIFNETLNYFTRPLNTLKKCEERNLSPGGVFIVSLWDYSGHNGIWKQLDKQYKTILEKEVTNARSQKWKVKLLQPLQHRQQVNSL
ncbi:MAG: class I SAM-dependent methyltransferase [Janthinobacterium lividum]